MPFTNFLDTTAPGAFSAWTLLYMSGKLILFCSKAPFTNSGRFPADAVAGFEARLADVEDLLAKAPCSTGVGGLIFGALRGAATLA